MRRALRMLLAAAWLAAGAAGAAGETPPALSPGRARVQVAVADLRKEPVPPGPTLEHDPLEESQLLYGEPVEVLELQGEWARVAAPDQQEWTHNRRWEGYPGWMRAADLAPDPAGWSPNLVVTAKQSGIFKDAVPDLDRPTLTFSLGTRLMGTHEVKLAFTKAGSGFHHFLCWKVTLLDGSTCWILPEEIGPLKALAELKEDPEALRARIIETARLFLGDPYYWGGRSAHDPAAAGPAHTAVDCSGLVGLCYQAADVWIPRDAHEQWMKARPIRREHLQPADLIFLADPENALRITHVMLYAGDGKVIEGPGTGATVREIPLEERLREAGERRVHYGTYLSGHPELVEG